MAGKKEQTVAEANVEVANLEKPAEKLAAQYDHESDLNEFDDVPAKKPAEVPASPPPTPRKHPASLRRLAIRLGASEDAINQTSTSDLADWIEEQQIVLERERDSHERSRAVQNFNRKQEEAPAPVTPKEPDDLDVIEQFEKESNLDPKLAAIFKKLVKENRESKEQVGSLKKQADDRVIASAEERIDDCFATLPDKYQKLFGNGTLAECTASERKRRGAAFIAAQIDARNPPSPKILAKKLMAEADELFSVAPDEPAEDSNGYASLEQPKNGKALNGKRFTEEDFEQGTLARTTQRSSKPLKGKKAAVKAVSDKQRELGLTDQDFEAYEEDGMPE